MTVTISEIGISMKVSDTQKETGKYEPKTEAGECRDINREELVDDCVRRVLQILKSLGGR